MRLHQLGQESVSFGRDSYIRQGHTTNTHYVLWKQGGRIPRNVGSKIVSDQQELVVSVVIGNRENIAAQNINAIL